MRGLKGMNVIVTGSASGIGRAIAKRLGEEGSNVAIFDLNASGAKEVAGEITAAGGNAHAYACDITDYAAVAEAIAAFEAATGPLDGLVNNAGWDQSIRFIDTEPDFWRKVVDINLYGPLNLSHIALKLSLIHI